MAMGRQSDGVEWTVTVTGQNGKNSYLITRKFFESVGSTYRLGTIFFGSQGIILWYSLCAISGQFFSKGLVHSEFRTLSTSKAKKESKEKKKKSLFQM